MNASPTPTEADAICEEYSISKYGGTADVVIAMSKEIQRLRAALAARAASAAIPEGFALVPIGSTFAMKQAGGAAGRAQSRQMYWEAIADAIYRAMLSAAPAAVRAEAGEREQAADSIYVASRASVPQRPKMWRSLRSQGWPIISTWIDEAGPGETADMGELWVRIEREIASARGLVLHAEASDFPLKGALIEVGLALGMGKHVGVCTDVVFTDRQYRPFGSWMNHRLVKWCFSLDEARAWAQSSPQPSQEATPTGCVVHGSARPCEECAEDLHREQEAAPLSGEPVAWIRYCSDGTYEGPLMNAQIEDVRKRSGAWTPLYASPLLALTAEQLLTDAYAEGRRDEQQELSSVLPGTTYMDPPDGGAPTILEQLQRQAKDAARYLSIRAALLSGGPEWQKLAALLNIAPDTPIGVDDAVDVAFGIDSARAALPTKETP